MGGCRWHRRRGTAVGLLLLGLFVVWRTAPLRSLMRLRGGQPLVDRDERPVEMRDNARNILKAQPPREQACALACLLGPAEALDDLTHDFTRMGVDRDRDWVLIRGVLVSLGLVIAIAIIEA
jgi:hypothetical protein